MILYISYILCLQSFHLSLIVRDHRDQSSFSGCAIASDDRNISLQVKVEHHSLVADLYMMLAYHLFIPSLHILACRKNHICHIIDFLFIVNNVNLKILSEIHNMI